MPYPKPSKALNEADLLQRKAIHQKNISDYKTKKAIFGIANAPPYLDLLIDSEERELARCERDLELLYKHRQQLSWIGKPRTALRNLIDFVAPRNPAAKRRRTRIIRDWQKRLLFVLLFFFAVVTTAFVLSKNVIVLPNAQFSILPQPTSQVGYSEEVSQPVPPALPVQPLQSDKSNEALVLNTNGLGVILRYSPQDDSMTEFVVSEGDSVELIEMVDNKDKGVWWRVRLLDGFVEGYIRREYIVPK